METKSIIVGGNRDEEQNECGTHSTKVGSQMATQLVACLVASSIRYLTKKLNIVFAE
jgi:hypothetical protein